KRLEQLVGQAAGQRGLGDVDDEVGHLGLAGQLAQHLLQHLLHLRQLLAQRLQVGGAALFALELLAQGGLLALQAQQLVALAADQGEPGHRHDDDRDQHAEHHLGLLRPGADVVEVEFAELDLLLAHDAGPPAALAAGLFPWSTAASAASPAGCAASAAAASASACAASASGSIACPPFASAPGLASWTFRVKSYGSERAPLVIGALLSLRASMIDRSGLVIQPEVSRLRM